MTARRVERVAARDVGGNRAYLRQPMGNWHKIGVASSRGLYQESLPRKRATLLAICLLVTSTGKCLPRNTTAAVRFRHRAEFIQSYVLSRESWFNHGDVSFGPVPFRLFVPFFSAVDSC
ncbi:uncharacterized protein LOC116848592 isoform X1 [Odontomachus brunneus]|uniref:uncharacterized protein LOC116848592 isoform X1 n=1 Tax=Odontomachus brunneus TaxID=486640 RepID=UPI0013F2AF08|nr:uncharacterized protein LOC116848592 isoform X1 [Odontomachus brunneus]